MLRIFSSFTKLAASPGGGTSTCLSDEAKAGKCPVFINVNKGWICQLTDPRGLSPDLHIAQAFITPSTL